jgi:hypothetical protein
MPRITTAQARCKLANKIVAKIATTSMALGLPQMLHLKASLQAVNKQKSTYIDNSSSLSIFHLLLLLFLLNKKAHSISELLSLEEFQQPSVTIHI